jgi:hypothetical protein
LEKTRGKGRRLGSVGVTMGGGRNGRYMKWLVAVLAFLGTVYLFYQYRGLNSALREKEEELERLEDLQSRLGDQLKDLAGSHTSMQDELKTERVDHHRTRMGTNFVCSVRFP